MITLDWHDVDGKLLCDGYSVEPVAGKRWLLTLEQAHNRSAPFLAWTRSRTYASLRSARAAALHLEVTRVRRIKLVRHIVVAALALVCAVAFYTMMAEGGEAHRLEWFVLAGMSLVASLSEGLDVFVLLVADGWDHRYEVPRVSAVDRWVATAALALLWPRRNVVAAPEPRVRIIG